MAFKDRIAGKIPLVVGTATLKQDSGKKQDTLGDILQSALDRAQKLPEPEPEPDNLDLSIFDSVDTFAQAIVAQEKQEGDLMIEKTPRTTVLKMFNETKFSGMFTFRVMPHSAELYVNAMRQVISRTRAYADKRKMPLKQFKMYCIRVVRTADFDEITLECTPKAKVENNAFQELAELFRETEEGE